MFRSSILGVAFDAALQQLKREELAFADSNANNNPNANINNNNNNYNYNRNDDDEDEDDYDENQNQSKDTKNNKKSSKKKNKKSKKQQQQQQQEVEDDQVPEVLLDNLFNALDSGSSAFTENQESNLWTIFDASMQEALATTRSAPKNEVRISIHGNELDENTQRLKNSLSQSSSSSSNTQFPLYRYTNQEWTIILRNPKVEICGSAIQNEEISDKLKPMNFAQSYDLKQQQQQQQQQQQRQQQQNQNQNQKRSDHLPSSFGQVHSDMFRQLECDYAVLHLKHNPSISKQQIDKTSSSSSSGSGAVPSRRKRK